MAAKVEVVHPSLLIRIREAYRTGMTAVELYDATRASWRLGPRREAVQFAMAVNDGIVVEVYEVDDWHPAGHARWAFTGHVADDGVADRYRGRSVAHYFKRGAQNPIKYAGLETGDSPEG